MGCPIVYLSPNICYGSKRILGTLDKRAYSVRRFIVEPWHTLFLIDTGRQNPQGTVSKQVRAKNALQAQVDNDGSG